MYREQNKKTESKLIAASYSCYVTHPKASRGLCCHSPKSRTSRFSGASRQSNAPPPGERCTAAAAAAAALLAPDAEPVSSWKRSSSWLLAAERCVDCGCRWFWQQFFLLLVWLYLSAQKLEQVGGCFAALSVHPRFRSCLLFFHNAFGSTTRTLSFIFTPSTYRRYVDHKQQFSCNFRAACDCTRSSVASLASCASVCWGRAPALLEERAPVKHQIGSRFNFNQSD